MIYEAVQYLRDAREVCVGYFSFGAVTVVDSSRTFAILPLPPLVSPRFTGLICSSRVE